MAYGKIVGLDKTTLYLPPEISIALRECSRRTGKPQAQLIREALDTYLAQQPQPQPRSLALGKDPHLAARDSEAWLDQSWQRP